MTVDATDPVPGALVVGLEVHVRLLTATKLFCSCALDADAPANAHVCPVCLGHPGALPLPNREAVRLAVLLGVALGCHVPPFSRFARKHYMYPDLPKGYQITQGEAPIAVDGRIGGIGIERAHLEEDAAKLVHVGASGRIHDTTGSLVDHNRGGAPLVEIVTRPVFDDPAVVGRWLRLLRALVVELGVSDGRMSDGSLRVDANVSIRDADGTLGVKTELKNMNSIVAIERAIAAEAARHRALIASGEEVVQATVHYDPVKDVTHVLRVKETAADYRYLGPDPDLADLCHDDPADRPSDLGEHPFDRWERLSLVLPAADALRLSTDATLTARHDALVGAGVPARRSIAHLDHAHSPARTARVEALVADGRLPGHAALELLARAEREGVDPELLLPTVLVDIDALVDDAIALRAADATAVAAGNDRALGPLVGHVMRASTGPLDGVIVRDEAPGEAACVTGRHRGARANPTGRDAEERASSPVGIPVPQDRPPDAFDPDVLPSTNPGGRENGTPGCPVTYDIGRWGAGLGAMLLAVSMTLHVVEALGFRAHGPPGFWSAWAILLVPTLLMAAIAYTARPVSERPSDGR